MTSKTERAVRKDCKTQELDIETVCAGIAAGYSMTAVAKGCGLSIASLVDWLEADPQRSARAKEIRSHTAQVWDDMAATGLSEARDPFELAKAKELAHHYRWRASKIAPKSYGDRVQQEISGPNGGPIDLNLAAMSDGDLQRCLELYAKIKEIACANA